MPGKVKPKSAAERAADYRKRKRQAEKQEDPQLAPPRPLSAPGTLPIEAYRVRIEGLEQQVSDLREHNRQLNEHNRQLVELLSREQSQRQLVETVTLLPWWRRWFRGPKVS